MKTKPESAGASVCRRAACHWGRDSPNAIGFVDRAKSKTQGTALTTHFFLLGFLILCFKLRYFKLQMTRPFNLILILFPHTLRNNLQSHLVCEIVCPATSLAIRRYRIIIPHRREPALAVVPEWEKTWKRLQLCLLLQPRFQY